MKKILILYSLILLVILWWGIRPSGPKHFTQPMREIPQSQIDPAYEHIRHINDLHSEIRSLYAEMDLTVSQKMSHRISGQLMFEKDRKLRVICSSKFRKEIDIGSNDQYFWFWSVRMSPPTLYYCPQSHISSNRLRTPFHPLWIIETLSIGNVDLTNSQVVEQGNNLAVLQQRVSTTGEPILKITLVNRNSPTIVGHYIFNSRGEMIMSTEVESHQKVGSNLVPLHMRTVWYEEGVTLLWSFRNVQINPVINPETWEMPSVRRSQDIRL